MTAPFENIFIVNACKSDGGFANPHRLFIKINRVLVEFTYVPTSIRGVGVKNFIYCIIIIFEVALSRSDIMTVISKI